MLCGLSLYFAPLLRLASGFFSQTFTVLNAWMLWLWNTPVGELIQKQGANECIDRKAKEVCGQRLDRESVVYGKSVDLGCRRIIEKNKAYFAKHSFCSMLRCPVAGTDQTGKLYRRTEP